MDHAGVDAHIAAGSLIQLVLSCWAVRIEKTHLLTLHRIPHQNAVILLYIAARFQDICCLIEACRL